MEWWGVMGPRVGVRILCAVVGIGGGLSAGVASSASLLLAQTQDAQDAADLADASADSPVQRALSTIPVKVSTDKPAAAAAAAHTDTVQKPASPAPASKPASTSLGETLHVAVKDAAVSTGAIEAKQYLSTEFGSDAAADADADSNVLRRRANHGSSENATTNAPPRSEQQLKLDEEQASFLASALVREVVPWAIGAAVLLGCLQGLRAMLVFSRRQTQRKHKYRKASRTRNARP